jgi:hypothetical protein
LRSFTFGHVRQIDRVLGQVLARAWWAGAGPGKALVIDVDSFVSEVHGHAKQGAGDAIPEARLPPAAGHPLRTPARSCTSASARARRAPGARALRVVDELLARVRRAGAAGQILLRADSGFQNQQVTRSFASRAAATRSAPR